MVSRDLTPIALPLWVLACPVVRLRPKVMSFLSLLRRCRPAHRRCAAFFLDRVRALFRSAKQMRGRNAHEYGRNGRLPRPPKPLVSFSRVYRFLVLARGSAMNKLLS